VLQNKIIIMVVLLGLIGLAIAQVDTAWVRRYNGLGSDTDWAYAIAVDDSGNVYVTGSTSGSGTGNDWATIKYNPNGDTVWVRHFISPGSYDERASAIALGNSGNIYITGYTMSSDSGDFLTIKYTPNGDTVWTKRADGPVSGYDFANAITVDGSENIYVTGYSKGSGLYNWEYMTIKYDSAGNQQWARRYNYIGGREEANAIGVDRFGSVYVTGRSNAETTGSKYDYATVRYDADGDFRWAARYNGPADSNDVANAIAIDDSGYIYVTGTSIGIGSANDIATIKYTPLADTIWVRRYNGPPGDSSDEGYGVAVDNWSNVYVTGSSKDSGTGPDYVTVKYNYLGAQQWEARYNNSSANGSDVADGGIAVDAQGNVYVTGYSMGSGTDYDYATVRYNSSGVEQWAARYNSSVDSADQAEAIAVDGHGNVYVTGFSRGPGTGLDWATIKYVQSGYVHRDVGTTVILSPAAVVSPGATVVPACSVYNYGDTIETYLVRMKIGTLYEDTVRVTSHTPGTYQYLSFATWNATQLGMYAVSCSTELLIDGIKRNDRLTSSVVVGNVDVELVRILSPTGTVDTLPQIPRARIRNNSSVTLDIPITFTITKDTIVYQDTRIITLAGNGSVFDVAFETFYITGADTGNFTTEARVAVFGDQNPGNDFQTGAFTVVVFIAGPGWQPMAPIPQSPSGKRPKSGSRLAAMRDNIYFLKASNTGDFYIYTPDAGIGFWTELETIPKGIKEDGDGKRPKKGAAMVAYQQEHAIYILRGNNTVGFWKYQADSIGSQTIGWHKLANILPGLKRCKYGSGLVTFRQHGNGYIFAMKGAKTNEFYVYHIEGDSWTQVSSPPIGTSGKLGYKKGSCLAYDGDEFVYVLQGYYGSFFKYSVDSDSWHELRQYEYKTFLNRDGKKKKPKDGAALAYYQDNIYLLKGGNTREFWRYEIASDSWMQMNPMETWDIPLGLSGKKVKGGGCMTIHDSYFYAAKGKNTDEFYRHTLPIISAITPATEPTGEGTTGKRVATGGYKLLITPNPANNVMSVKYSLPTAEPVIFKLYNVTGALVKSYSNPNPTRQGVLLIDARILPSGVYILRFNSGDFRITRKLVLEK